MLRPVRPDEVHVLVEPDRRSRGWIRSTSVRPRRVSGSTTDAARTRTPTTAPDGRQRSGSCGSGRRRARLRACRAPGRPGRGSGRSRGRPSRASSRKRARSPRSPRIRSPWMQPTTSTRGPGSPTRWARIGRPCSERESEHGELPHRVEDMAVIEASRPAPDLPHDHGRAPPQAARGRGGPRRLVRRRPGRALRAARAERRRQDDDDQDADHAAPADKRPGPRARARRRHRAREPCGSGSATSSAATAASTSASPRWTTCATSPSSTASPGKAQKRRIDEVLELVGLNGREQRARRGLLARHAPAPAHRPRDPPRPARSSSSTSRRSASTRSARASCARRSPG